MLCNIIIILFVPFDLY